MVTTTKDRLSDKQLFLLVLAVAAALRIASFFLSENAGGDALARAQLTARWLQHPGLEFHFDVWLPLHFWLMGAFAFIVSDVELGARLLSLVLGIASVGALWVLTRELDGPRSALFSTIIFALSSLNIAYSTTSSCDGPYLFFVITGLALFFRARRTQRWLLLILAGLSLTIGAGIRYEAWIIIAALNAILLFRREWRELLFFLISSSLFPVFWLLYEWRTRGNPLYAPMLNFTWVANDISFYGTSLAYRLALPAGVVFLTLTPLAVLGFILSIKQIWKQKGRLAEFAFVLILFAAVQFYQIVMGGAMAYARYMLTLVMMTTVFAGIGLAHSFPKLKWLVATMVLFLALGILLSTVKNPFINKARSVSPILHFTIYLEDTGKYLRNHLGVNDAVVIDDYNYETNLIAHLAGIPLLGSERAFIMPDRIDPEKQKRKFGELLPYLKSRRPKYLVYANEGALSSFLRFPSDCSPTVFDGMQFSCVLQNEKYQVYEINYER